MVCRGLQTLSLSNPSPLPPSTSRGLGLKHLDRSVRKQSDLLLAPRQALEHVVVGEGAVEAVAEVADAAEVTRKNNTRGLENDSTPYKGRTHLERMGETRASPWLIRQLRYGIQLPWIKTRRRPYLRGYQLSEEQAEFCDGDIKRWLDLCFILRAAPEEAAQLKRNGQLSQGFIAWTSGRWRLAVDYKVVNMALEDRTFKMEQLQDLVPTLQPHDSLYKADLKDGYYYMKRRRKDQSKLEFEINGEVYIPLCLNCGLKVAPWFFTKMIKPVIAEMRRRGHRACAYIDDILGAAKRRHTTHATPEDTAIAETDLVEICGILVLQLHPRKKYFSGSQQLQILGIVVDTPKQQFLLSPRRVEKVTNTAL